MLQDKTIELLTESCLFHVSSHMLFHSLCVSTSSDLSTTLEQGLYSFIY
jgi:hypothetical protein